MADDLVTRGAGRLDTGGIRMGEFVECMMRAVDGVWRWRGR